MPYRWISGVLIGIVSYVVLASPDGVTLYTRHCAACHGAKGMGGVGVPLALPGLQATVDDNYLRLTIRLGRPGRVMPAFSQLTDQNIAAIVQQVRSFGNSPPALPAVKPPQGDAGRGAKIFAGHCAACHGAQGEGSHGTGVTFSRPRDLPILAPALNNPGFLAAASDNLLKTTLLHGREDTPMLSFIKQGLSEADVDDVVAYVRSFALQSHAALTPDISNEPPILMRTSRYDVAETAARVQDVMTRYNLGIIRAVPFNQGMVDAKDENPEQRIIDGCDFGFLNKALAVDPRVGLFLPCRVTITRQHGKVVVMTINPKRLAAIFNNAELNELCEEMSKLYNDLLDEAVQ